MLNGIDPIIIFQFGKILPSVSEVLAQIPVVSSIPTIVDQPPIPIYLSQSLTGLHIMTEEKSVDIETSTETMTDGSTPSIEQKGISSLIKVSLVANKESLGVALLSAMIDQVYEKASSKEYSITYLHGAVTIFRGVLHSYSVNQNANEDKLDITFEISKGAKTPQKAADVPVVGKTTGAVPL